MSTDSTPQTIWHANVHFTSIWRTITNSANKYLTKSQYMNKPLTYLDFWSHFRTKFLSNPKPFQAFDRMFHLLLVKVRFVYIEQLTVSTTVTKGRQRDGDTPRMNSKQIDFSYRCTIFQRVPKQENPFKMINGISDLTSTLQEYIRGKKKKFDPSPACLVRRTQA